MYTNVRRPENPKVKLDFVAECVDSGKTVFIDHKGMIDFASLAVPTAHFPSHEVVAFRMCIESIRQKKRYLFLDQGPVFMEDVVHL